MTQLEHGPNVPDVHSLDTFEQRWAAWQARGVAGEAKTRVRLLAAFAIVLLVGGATLAWMADFRGSGR